MKRREFIKLGTLAAFGTAAGCRTASTGGSMTVNGIRIGVQMWSVNDIWKKDPVTAFRRLKAMGYDGVQSLNFFHMNYDELAKMLDDTGLVIVDMPFRKSFLAPDKFGRYVEFCQRFNVDFIYHPLERLSTATEWLKYAKWLSSLSEKFRPYGIKVGYHNHRHELLEHYEGKTPMEFLCDEKIPMELDVGHLKLAKEDPVAWLKRLNGLVPSIHAKPGGGDSVGGKGDENDWAAIFSTASAIGTKWAVVECETRRNTYADVEASAEFLRSLKV